MKIRVTTTVPKDVEIEVHFPLYIKRGDVFDSGGWYDTWRRIDRHLNEYIIQVNDKDEWEFSLGKTNKASLGYMLVQEKVDYEVIDAKQFYEKLDELRRALDAVPAIGEGHT